MKNSSLLTYKGLSLSFCYLFGPVLLFSCPKIMSFTEPWRYLVHLHICTRKKHHGTFSRTIIFHSWKNIVRPIKCRERWFFTSELSSFALLIGCCKFWNDFYAFSFLWINLNTYMINIHLHRRKTYLMCPNFVPVGPACYLLSKTFQFYCHCQIVINTSMTSSGIMSSITSENFD